MLERDIKVFFQMIRIWRLKKEPRLKLPFLFSMLVFLFGSFFCGFLVFVFQRNQTFGLQDVVPLEKFFQI